MQKRTEEMNFCATPAAVWASRTPEKTGRPLGGNVIRSRGDNEVIVLAGHIHSHGGSWKKCVETPFPVQLCGEAEVRGFTSSPHQHSQTMKGVGGGGGRPLLHLPIPHYTADRRT